MTPAEFISAWYGYADSRRSEELATLRATRQHAFLILSALCKKMPDTPAKLMPLPDDESDDDDDEPIDIEAIRERTLAMNDVFGD